MVVLGYIASFLFGAFALALAQLLLLWFFFNRTTSRRRRQQQQQQHDQPPPLPSFSLDSDPNAPSSIVIEGEVWVAAVSPFQVDCVNKSNSLKIPKDKKQKREIEHKSEISVLLKYAKLQDKTLLLNSSDGTSLSLQLEGCSVLAVSSSTASRKWAKKYPVKLEHSSRVLMGTTVCLLYFKTGWEKETWCEALRAAARTDYGPEDWYSKLKHEFGEYVCQLKQSFPDVFKVGSATGRNIKGSTPSTKKSISWKRLLKKKRGEAARTKAVTVQTEETRAEEPFHLNTSSSYQDFDSLRGESDSNNHSDTNPDASSAGGRRHLESSEVGSGDFEVHTPVTALTMLKPVDGGVAALNIMLSRLFFDLHHSSDFISVVHNRIQTLLSRIPTPGYISPITCSRIDIGKTSPFVHGLRPFPIADDVFGVEADIEYTGGAVLTLETRLDMRESRVGEQKANETSSAGAATADIISKSLETVEDDLEVAGDAPPDQSSGSAKRRRWNQWKTFLSTVADQVSQVPLTLSMRVVSLKGTLQLRIRGSPSDRIWYSFASMPALELLPEPSVGDHKITTGPLLAYIAERIQILVYETMVYPNSEDIHIPWMVSDEENWAHPSAAPFPQVLTEPKGPEKQKESNSNKADREGGEIESESTPAAEGGELETPLLDKKPEVAVAYEDAAEDTGTAATPAAAAAAAASTDYQGSEGESSFREDSKRKKGTRREKMISFGKKFEEKTRQLAEKMRERFEKE